MQAQGSRDRREGEPRPCGVCVWRAPVAPQLIASRAGRRRLGLSHRRVVAVCESLPSWRAERRCRGSIPRPALCVGCKELAVLSLCELQPGAEGGRSSAQGAALGTRRSRARGGSRDRRHGRAGGRTRASARVEQARQVRNARSECARCVRDAARKHACEQTQGNYKQEKGKRDGAGSVKFG